MSDIGKVILLEDGRKMRKLLVFPLFLGFVLLGVSAKSFSTLLETTPEPETPKSFLYVSRYQTSLEDVVNATQLRQIYALVMVNDVSSYNEYKGEINRSHPMYYGFPFLVNSEAYPTVQFGGVHNRFYLGAFDNQDPNATLYWTKVTNTKLFQNPNGLWLTQPYQNQTFLHWSNGTATTIEDLRCPLCEGYMSPAGPELYNFRMFWLCERCRVIVAEQFRIENKTL